VSARHRSSVLHEPLIRNSTDASRISIHVLSLDRFGFRSLR
jgi:hypothetical protein